MKILYKYYSSNFNIFEHLKKPLIKLAHTETFNDPFESRLAEKLAEKLSNDFLERFKNRGDTSREITDDDFQYHRNHYIKSPSGFGVTSLTETHRNILMWAHYANSHQGICIGYKSDFISVNTKNPHPDNFGNMCPKPKRVKYDSKRFDYEKYLMEAGTENISNAILDSMTTKSNEWMYEKEHRCILPFVYAEHIILTKEPSKELQTIINRLLRKGFVSKGKGKLEYIRRDDLKLAHQYFTNVDFSKLAKSQEAMILKKIDKNKIESIYFGCQANEDRLKRIISFIERNVDSLGHIKIYKYQTNPDTFEINETRLR